MNKDDDKENDKSERNLPQPDQVIRPDSGPAPTLPDAGSPGGTNVFGGSGELGGGGRGGE